MLLEADPIGYVCSAKLLDEQFPGFKPQFFYGGG